MEDEVPMCISCWDPFDPDEVIPRVLTCGHSLCERCIPGLDAMKQPSCPICKTPLRVGNIHLFPKNFELLRFLASTPDKVRRPPDPGPPPRTSSPDFIFWNHELVSRWKKWIMPPEVIDVQSVSMDSEKSLTKARIGDCIKTVRGMDVEANRLVSLLPIRRAPAISPRCGLRLNYMGRILNLLDGMEERMRKELAAMLEAVSRQRRGILTVYGLWMNSSAEESMIYLVCESLHRDLSGFLDQEMKLHFRVLDLELCEALMGLHSHGIVCGVLSPSCFFLDNYGHCLLDLNHVLQVGRVHRERIGSSKHIEGSKRSWAHAFVSPELFLLSQEENNSSNSCTKVSHSSDVWSLACVLAMLLGDASLNTVLSELSSNELLSIDSYRSWMEKVIYKLQASSMGEDLNPLKENIQLSLSFEPNSRPQVADLWKCIRKLVFGHHTDHIGKFDVPFVTDNSACCLFLFDHTQNGSLLQCSDSTRVSSEDVDSMEIIEKDNSQVQGEEKNKGKHSGVGGQCPGEEINTGHFAGMPDVFIKSFSLEGHHACVTGLAIGGGFLFSSSNDKTIRAWSLQDFSYSHTLIGHEHRITAMVVTESKKLCISADFGGFICAWAINSSCNQVPMKKWLEHTNWHFGKVNSLAIDEYRIFSCSGDKSINVWSLKDFKQLQKMEGHESAVCSLVVANGTLYSSSRDGTIRLWWLDDYTVMGVLKNEEWYSLSALSLSVDEDLLVATYENGYIKIWRDNVAMKVMKIEDGAIFASQMVKKKWLFLGGWDKAIGIQRVVVNEYLVDAESFGSIVCHSSITSLLYWQGKLFVGFSNKDIKVYCLEKF